MIKSLNKRNKIAINGWLLIDKQIGITSFQVISELKKILTMKVGHCGTLDPFASGLLLVAIGKATKLVEYAMAMKKDYTFTVQWGASTDTDDLTGQIQETSNHIPTKDEIEEKLGHFLGANPQIPPIFSAVKVNGRRAYDYARKGEDIILKPKTVLLEKFSMISHSKDETTFNIVCGKGFYVRSLARDLAKSLNTLAHVKMLRRNPSGIFKNKELISSVKVKDFLHKGKLYDCIMDRILPLDYVLDDIPVHNLVLKEAIKLRNGHSISCSSSFKNNSKIAVRSEDRLIALCTFWNNYLKPIKVF